MLAIMKSIVWNGKCLERLRDSYPNSWAVDFEDGLTDCQSAVVPDDQEHEENVQDSMLEVQTGGCQHAPWKQHCSVTKDNPGLESLLTYQGDNQLELLVLIFVIVALLFVQDGHVDTPQDELQIRSGLPWQDLFHLDRTAIAKQSFWLMLKTEMTSFIPG